MTAPAATATKSPSVLEDIVDVFYQPAAVFERRRNAGFGLALLLYAILSAVMLYAARPVMRPVFERQMDQAIEKINANPNISADQKESIGNRMRGAIDSPFALIVPIILIPLTLFITALVLWLVGKAFGSSASYSQAAMVTTFASFPRLLLGAIVTGFSLATGREVGTQFGLTLSPAAMLGADASPVYAALLSRLDVGTLWTTALLGIGIAIVGRVSRTQGYMTAAVVWLLGGAFIVLSALRQMAG
ncbi:Yip1 domain-containing protein [Gemmatirosa kalamazoonensis]|uniref:Yip1 domain-containing protein n=1 Tax=Gemmatirosa kalamazoonensis TaxID=861299 RepID=W0RP11_9BACT|nr:YIP1 family protein [Gemmatirosa kalamazoonensis]AHG91183.1 Yip1 domain-containing protein [Gemmatirosa kalamazoonensis]